MSRRVSRVFLIIFLPVCLFTLLGYMGSSFWIFDLCAHFRLQYLLLLLIPSIYFFFRKKLLLGLTFSFFVLLNTLEVAPVYTGGSSTVPTESSITVGSINLLSSNYDLQKVKAFIRDKNPDVLVLQEFHNHWQQDLGEVIVSFPYQKLIPRDDNFGIAILSKVNIQSITELNLSALGLPSLLATLTHQGHTFQILNTHPVPPMGQTSFQYRNAHLASMAAMKPVLEDHLIIIGDLNITSYAPNFKRLVRDLELKDSRQGFGILPTWPAYFYPLMVTIDHCLVSKSLVVKDRGTGDNTGSDHLPIYVEVGFPD